MAPSLDLLAPEQDISDGVARAVVTGMIELGIPKANILDSGKVVVMVTGQSMIS